ncbi:MAG: hypothetical protein K6B45_08120 [Bacteroidaceae bacterium]|nr:hypothetical protein [Bacteroidaceae bacterium]
MDTKRYYFLFLGLVCNTCLLFSQQAATDQTEVMAWGNLTGIRVEGELMDFETTLVVGGSHSGRERYTYRYERQGDERVSTSTIERVTFAERVTDTAQGRCHVSLQLASDTTLDVHAGLCLHLNAEKYATASIKTTPRKLSVRLKDADGVVRDIQMSFSRPVKLTQSRGNDEICITVPVMTSLVKGATATLDMDVTASGRIDHSDAVVRVDTSHPGRSFLGMGGNFRLQNPATDPAVIDYCLRNIRVAYGRVEMPWRQWHPDEDATPLNMKPDELPQHVRQSMEMAQRLAAQGMPVIVSCWFPPMWAIDKTSPRRGRWQGVAAHRLDPAKQQRIVSSLTDYLVYLKEHYGVEAALFSFNESDLGIDVLHSPEEHAAFIKDMGREMRRRGLATKMLLGDTSDATPTRFVVPALNDPAAHPFIGAVSFHSWRGCDDATLRVWADAAAQLGVPLLVGEGSTDAAAWRYPQIFRESTFALYEINLYVRMLNVCQPQSILHWQLTADYSLLWGGGVFGTSGELTPTQRFWNIRQLASTPEGSFALPVSSSKATLTCAAFGNLAKGEYCVHMVNNGAACNALIQGLPEHFRSAKVLVTNAEDGMKETSLTPSDGKLSLPLPPVSFVTLILKK